MNNNGYMASSDQSSRDGATEPTIREQLLAGSTALIEDEGFGDLSVRRLATASGRSTMCLYTKFGSRSALLEALFAERLDELLGLLRGSADPPGALARFAEQRPQVYALLFSVDLDALGVSVDRRREALEQIVAVLAGDDGVTEGERRWAMVHGYAALSAARSGPAQT